MMNRRLIAGVGAAVVLSVGAAPGALADPTQYPPSVPTSAAGICVGDVPFLAYSVDFGSAEFVGDPMTITFVNPSGEDYVINTTVPAPGDRPTVIWPGASVNPQDWPGWVLDENGRWVESTTDPGAFTRAPGGVEVQFATNPTLTTTVTYPPASSVCANPKNQPTPRGGTNPGGTTPGGTTPGAPGEGAPGQGAPTTTAAATTGASIPSTGGSLLPALAGAAALALGGGLVIAARKRRG